MSADKPKTPSSKDVESDNLKHEAEEVDQAQKSEVSSDHVVEEGSDENLSSDNADDEDQPVVKLLDDLTTEDFKKLGLPIGGHDGLSDHVPENAIDDDISHLEQAFSPLLLRKDKEKALSNAYDRCLRSLLVELKWPGEERHIIQALPHFRDMDDIHSFRAVLHHLGFDSRVRVENASNLEKRLPCLMIDDESRPRIGLRFLPNGKLLVYDCLLYTSPSPRDQRGSRMPSSA